MKSRKGQALIEVAVFFLVLSVLLGGFAGFTKWFVVRQKLMLGAKLGALLYSSGHWKKSEVEARMKQFLITGSPPLNPSRIRVFVGPHSGALSWVLELDESVASYTPSGGWHYLLGANPTITEKFVVKHAPHYWAPLQPWGDRRYPMDIKRFRLRIGLFSALVFVSAAFGIDKIRRASLWNTQDPADWSTVLVASRYVPAFSVLGMGDIEEKEFPKDLVPPGALHSVQALANEQGQARYISTVAIPRHHPLTQAILIDASREDVLGALLGPGQVAVSFEMERARGVGGWIKPGDKVALFGSEEHLRSRLLFPALLVLAVDRARIGDPKTSVPQNPTDPLASSLMLETQESNVLTVLATLSQAMVINRAREEGNLSVVLRSPGDEIPWPKEK